MICGVDEAGRGPLAGSVVAAAVILNPAHKIMGLDDSKKLNEKTRLRLYYELLEHHHVSFCSIPSTLIDRINIRQATLLAMRKAVFGLNFTPTKIIVDGRDEIPELTSTAIIDGDAKEQVIAAASIIAKVTRDKMMLYCENRYPVYGFAKHKGYGTKLHLEALKQFGACPIHRLSYAPVTRLSLM